jgi:hypothetical protein
LYQFKLNTFSIKYAFQTLSQNNYEKRRTALLCLSVLPSVPSQATIRLPLEILSCHFCLRISLRPVEIIRARINKIGNTQQCNIFVLPNISLVFCVLCYCLVCVFVTPCVLFYYVCVAVLHTLVAGLWARSQYPDDLATGHIGTGFSWFPYVYK